MNGSSLIQLKLRKAFSQKSFDLIDGMGIEQIQYHGIGDHKLTINRFGMASESFSNDMQVEILKDFTFRDLHQ